MDAHLKLVRFDYGAQATVGRLFYPDGRSWWAYTLEPPWIGNRPSQSCIPEGLYRVTRDSFRGRYPNFRLHGVHGRSDIELHRGDTVDDTEGCVIVGESLGALIETGWRLWGSSEHALTTLMQACPFDEGELLVTSSTGRPW